MTAARPILIIISQCIHLLVLNFNLEEDTSEQTVRRNSGAFEIFLIKDYRDLFMSCS